MKALQCIPKNTPTKITFPPLWKFRKNSLKIRGPTPLINYIRASKSPTELKNALLQNFTERDRRRIYEKTKNQSQVFEWKLYRQGAISGTLIKRVMMSIKHKKEPSPSLNRSISKFWNNSFSNEAMRYGVIHEKDGIQVLWKYFKKKHKNATMVRPGLVIHKTLPFLVGTPDVLFYCENCCEKGKKVPFVGEVKCPFRLASAGIASACILEYLDSNSNTLKKSHSYTYQQNLYCGLINASLCYFIIWTPKGHLILEIDFDPDLYQSMEVAAKKYFYEKYVTDFFSTI